MDEKQHFNHQLNSPEGARLTVRVGEKNRSGKSFQAGGVPGQWSELSLSWQHRIRFPCSISFTKMNVVLTVAYHCNDDGSGDKKQNKKQQQQHFGGDGDQVTVADQVVHQVVHSIILLFTIVLSSPADKSV